MSKSGAECVRILKIFVIVKDRVDYYSLHTSVYANMGDKERLSTWNCTIAKIFEAFKNQHTTRIYFWMREIWG